MENIMNGHGQNSSASGGSIKLADLFETHQGVPISRQQVCDVASQLDPLKRIRRNGGARDILDPKGIAILWGGGDSYVIGQLGLGPVAKSEFIAYTPANQAELNLLRANGHANLQSPGFP